MERQGATRMDPTIRQHAIDWINDCDWCEQWGGSDWTADELTNDQIKLGINRHFEGGWIGFLHAL